MKSALEIGVGLACGIGLGSVLGWERNAEMKYVAPLIGLILLLIAILAFRRAERICLAAFIAAVPFPMHAFLLKLDPMHGGGALGIYIMGADLPLVVLYLCWFFDRNKDAFDQPPRSSRHALYLVPFVLFSTLSVAWSPHPLWAVCEILRWLKVLLILIYAAKRLRREDIPFCAWVLMGSAGLQSAIAILQSVKHSNLGLDKLGVFGKGGEEAVTQSLDSGVQLFRGTGLTGHPNFLASYLLLSLPIFAMLALVEKRPWLKASWCGGFLVSFAGLCSTMSRAAWVSFLIAGLFLFFVAVAQSLISVRRATFLALSALAIAGVLGLSFSDFIRERFKGDWSESWKLRVELNEAAIAMAQDHVIGGVGSNNFTAEFPQYDPSMANIMLEIDNMYTVVHNVYLLVWAEVGTIGLAAYAFFFIATFVRGARSLRSMNSRDRALTLGILAGVFGAMMFDLTEISLTMEICMYSLAFWIGALEPLSTSRRVGIIAIARPRVRESWLSPSLS
jgi:putative inorganic carbon (HCO3(-)) transporter